jgi:hypothetical protein
MLKCVCVCVCVRACLLACLLACPHAGERENACMHLFPPAMIYILSNLFYVVRFLSGVLLFFMESFL